MLDYKYMSVSLEYWLLTGNQFVNIDIFSDSLVSCSFHFRKGSRTDQTRQSEGHPSHVLSVLSARFWRLFCEMLVWRELSLPVLRRLGSNKSLSLSLRKLEGQRAFADRNVAFILMPSGISDPELIFLRTKCRASRMLFFWKSEASGTPWRKTWVLAL